MIGLISSGYVADVYKTSATTKYASPIADGSAGFPHQN
jgi:hypothetical protein